jgi:hypothetical protein
MTRLNSRQCYQPAQTQELSTGVFMGDREAAAILAFPASRPARSFANSGERRGVVLPLRTVDESHDDDLAFSPQWDEMSKLAMAAWSWRDPDSLARLEECIDRLWPEVARDWGSSRERRASARRPRRYFGEFVVVLGSLVSRGASWWGDLSSTTRV